MFFVHCKKTLHNDRSITSQLHISETVHEDNKCYSNQNVVVYSITSVLLNRYTAKKADCLWYSKR